MSYLLTFVRDQFAMYDATDEQMRQAMEAWNEFDREAIEAGVMLACAPLEHPSTGKTLRVGPSGEHSVTDGPFAETKEQLGGFALLACDSMDEALEWAGKVPMPPDGKIEVREVKDLSAWGYELKIPEPFRAVA
jgi:hypothetical protein